MKFNEDTIEQAAIDWLGQLGYAYVHGPDIAPGEHGAKRSSYSDVVLIDRLESAVRRLNPDLPDEASADAVKQVLRTDSPSLIAANRQFHKMLTDGVTVEYRTGEGSIKGDQAWLIDWNDPANNDWLVVNQFTVVEDGRNRRPDLIVFVNGLPLVIFELKNPGDEDATIDNAYLQLETYTKELPSLFKYNELRIISDGLRARIGSLTAGLEWFKPWPTIHDDKPINSVAGSVHERKAGYLAGSKSSGTDTKQDSAQLPLAILELEVLIRGVFEQNRFLQLVRNFILFEEDSDSDRINKILAGYHQFHAALDARKTTAAATKPNGSRQGGVVWHTQGSGKSFTMLFFAGLCIAHPEMDNPTIVVLTDRNDLDDQLFGQFQRCSQILRQTPVQAESVDNLRELLAVASGGVVFTTVHKFAEAEGQFPELTARENVVVIADEAHRSQYGFYARQKKDKDTGEISTAYGFARNIRDALPNATFVGFTGTPIEMNDKNTQAVFGNYVSVYDIQRAVDDKATVPIYYESRVIKMSFDEKLLNKIDGDFDDITEAEETETKDKLKTKWAAMEAMVGDDDRIKLMAADLVAHFEKRIESMNGKGMIVCMSRRICVDLYTELVRLRPEWHRDKDEEGTLKVIMTGSAADGPDWQQHIRTKERRKALASHYKEASSPFKLVIVRDMWLTGFDAPSMHTMYIDKPMQGHGLMQAIARVNRVYKEKPGGLVVDYLGIGDALKKALRTYTQSGGTGKTTIDAAEAVAALQKHHEQCCDMLHGFDWSKWETGTPAERATLPVAAQEHILDQDDGKPRWLTHVSNLSSAFALCPTDAYAKSIREDVAFFQIIRTMFRKYGPSGNSASMMEDALRDLVSRAVITADDEVIDVYKAAGIDRPEISILSETFLEEVRALPYQNVAVELLKKLLGDEIKIRRKRNVVKSRAFSEMLQETLNKYHNRAIDTQEIIDEMIRLAKDLKAADVRGEQLGLNLDEECFYDALANSADAQEVMGDDQLKVIATELVMKVRENVTIDWTLRENARARIRVIVKRILKKHGYPPNLSDAATQLVLEQAEALSAEWAT